jgi:methylated-DNA-[protein]-cysteine S-methyltransferase
MNRRFGLLIDHLDTPVGLLAIVADEEGGLRAVGWMDRHARMERQLRAYSEAQGLGLREAPNPGGFTAALRAYFAGDWSVIDRLTVAAVGTEFQQSVWRALRQIPCGETRSYGQISRQIALPNAARAVGLANAVNPVAVVVPCHRVVGSDGSLTGYGAGMDRKRWLLAHERLDPARGVSPRRAPPPPDQRPQNP